MASCKFARNIFIPAGVLVAEKAKSSATPAVCKPSELPLYSQDVCTPQPVKQAEPCPPPPGAIENAFGTVRRGLFAALNQYQTFKILGEEFIDSSVESAGNAVEYLQKEENTTPRVGAIALGTTSGYILGLRGGFFKRSFYGLIGGLGMCAICYPEEASEYSQIGLEEAKKYLTILYNFIYGVKKGDPPRELPSLPKIPGTMSEAWGIVKNFGNLTTSSVTDESQSSSTKKVCEPEEVVKATVVEPKIYEGCVCIPLSPTCPEVEPKPDLESPSKTPEPSIIEVNPPCPPGYDNKYYPTDDETTKDDEEKEEDNGNGDE